MVEHEDVPPELVGLIMAVRGRYDFYASGDDPAGMVRFAKRFARDHDGALWDPQTGEGWAKSGLRKGVKPEPGADIDLVEFEWWYRTPETVKGADAYLDAATAYLPEALPVRYDYDGGSSTHRFDPARAGTSPTLFEMPNGWSTSPENFPS